MKLETLATLTHINVRKEGKDEKVLAIDLRLSAHIHNAIEQARQTHAL